MLPRDQRWEPIELITERANGDPPRSLMRWFIPGTVRFETPEGNIDAAEGELMVVPPRAIHTFKNPSDTEDAEFFMTATPGRFSRHKSRL